MTSELTVWSRILAGLPARAMVITVKKFGGTSVGDVQRIRHVAELLRAYQAEHPQERLVIVVSAMAGETNKLITLAKSCVAEPNTRELDVLLTTGEQVTVALLAMALIDLGIPAKSLTATQAQIATDNRHTNAHIQQIGSRPIEMILEAGEVAVVAGFQGVDEQGNLTTLGRGGSDITAVALAAALKAGACYIYTDVEGVYSTDPRICSGARRLERVSHEEMLEMASLGAKVLHPRSVYFAMQYEVPLVVLSTFKPGPGTWIIKEEELMEKPVVRGISHRVDEAKLNVLGVPSGSKSLDMIFGRLAADDIFVDMITQSGGGDGTTNLSFTVMDENSSHALDVLQRCVPELGALGASLERDIAKVSVVGVGMRYHTGVAAKMFAALAAENIEVQMVSTSEIKISVIVPRKYCEVAVRTLHEAFVENQPLLSVER